LPMLLGLAACSSPWDLSPHLVRQNLPDMPVAAELDWAPHAGMAHAALPVFDPQLGRYRGQRRIWIKRSSECGSARLPASGTTSAVEPPYYPALVEAPPGEQTVELLGSAGAVRTLTVHVPDAAALDAPAPFSALFFGDFQPFVVDRGQVKVNAGEPVDHG